MASTDVWADFETLRHNVKHNTVDKLKSIVASLNDECHAGLTRAGRKQELIDKITNKLDIWKRTNDVNNWSKAKGILNLVRQSGAFHAPRTPPAYPAQAGYTTAHPALSPTSGAAPGPSFMIPSPTLASPTSSRPHYDAYGQHAQRRPPGPPHVPSASVPPSPSIRFKSSPFFRVERAISNVVECPESHSQIDRKQSYVYFSLNPDIIQKLQSASYQLRLYCTSSTYYSPATALRAGPAPIEFPPTCEVRVNNVQLNANLKGLKKKPGTAPPPDIGRNLKMTSGVQNKVEMVYVNSAQQQQQGLQPKPAPKKYYIVVMLVEVTTVEQLIDRLRKGKYRSNTEILAKLKQQVIDSDEIVAGHQKMNLKCPLSYMRIVTPCRSWHCVHPQCFDAFSWFSVMEQTTTWMCPVCEQVLNVDDLIIDGYFDEILKATPEEVEDVIVEPDGEWHTTDNKYGSSGWKAAHPTKPSPVKKRSPSPTKSPVRRENGAGPGGPAPAEIVILDSDEEDDDNRVKRELSPSNDGSQRTLMSGRTTANSSLASLPPRSQTADVIDLTLDSDEESPSPPPHRHMSSSQPVAAVSKKRASDELDLQSPTEAIWKKSRTETPAPGLAMPMSQGYMASGSVRPHPSSLSPSSGPYTSAYQMHSHPYSSSSYYRPTAHQGIASLPPRPAVSANGRFGEHGSSNPYPPRVNGSGSSSTNGWR